MQIKVNVNNICQDTSDVLNENEYNIHELDFNFSEEYSNDLVKVALFTRKTATYKVIIANDKCSIPPEILEDKGEFILGVYAYQVDNEELILRYSPAPIKLFVSNGSYIKDEDTENSEPITPSELEQYQQALQEGLSEVNGKLSEIDAAIEAVNQAVEDVDNAVERTNNLDLDVNKVEHTTTVTITKKDGTTKSVQILDGEKGQDGQDYVITQEDYQEIANLVEQQVEIPSKTSDLINDNGFIDNSVNDLINYTLTTQTGSKIELEINSSNYQMTAKLKDKNNNLVSTSNVIDLPIESMVVNASYSNGILTLTLQNGNTLDVDISDIVSGLVKPSDLTDYVKNTDYATTNKGGVIKTASGTTGAGTYVSGTGVLLANNLTYANYGSAGGNTFISKGTLENVITGKGLVSNTDYPTSSTGGVVKNVTTYGASINNAGTIFALTRTYSEYQSSPVNYIISKGTLENVLAEEIGDIESILEELDIGGGIE